MAMDIKEAAKKAGVPEEEMARALELLNKDKVRKAKIASGELKSQSWKDMTPEQKEKAKKAEKRRVTKIRLTLEKAAKQGITVTEAEIDQALAKK